MASRIILGGLKDSNVWKVTMNFVVESRMELVLGFEGVCFASNEDTRYFS
jgi:hypothetical protein